MKTANDGLMLFNYIDFFMAWTLTVLSESSSMKIEGKDSHMDLSMSSIGRDIQSTAWTIAVVSYRLVDLMFSHDRVRISWINHQNE